MKRVTMAVLCGLAGAGIMLGAACLGDPPLVASKPDGEGDAPVLDAPVIVTDAGLDAASLVDGGQLDAPRPTAPLSTARTTSKRPTFNWSLPPSIDGAFVEICKDRACTISEQSFAVREAKGAPPTELSPGVHFWRLRGIAGNKLGTTISPTWEVVIPFANAPNGVDTSWGSFPDPNGDGFADVLVTSYLTNAIDAFFGGPTGPGLFKHFTFAPATPDGGGALYGSDNFFTLTTGDLDGDGYVDIIAGYTCIFYDYNCGKNDGRVFIRRGGPNVLSVDGPPDVVILSPDDLRPPPNDAGYASPRFGLFNCSVGDVNGDGYGDLVISAVSWDGASKGDNSGNAFLYRGGPTATTAPGALESLGPGAAGVQWGGCMPAGDVNGDGFADFVIVSGKGDNHLFFGGTGTLTRVKLALPAIQNVYASGFPRLANGVSDLDGDGLSDIVLGGSALAQTDGGGEPLGRVFVYRGSKTVSDPKPFEEEIKGTQTSMSYGVNVSACGDVNGDGIDDLIVASLGDPQLNQGWIYFIAGKSGPLLSPSDGGLEMGRPPDIVANGYFGTAMSPIGDFDGDTYPDIAVSFGQYIGGNGYVTRAIYILLGGKDGLSPTRYYRLDDPKLGSDGTYPNDWLDGAPVAPAAPSR